MLLRLLLMVVLMALMVMVPGVDGHGRLMDPPARNSMWRLGFPNPVNYNDNELYCGGRLTQWARNKGKCGVCGDPYHAKKPHEVGGKYANEIITRHYKQGDTIDVTVHITANHKGYFEFRICPAEDNKVEVTQECLDKGVLGLAQQEGTRYYLDAEKSNQFFNVTLQLPKDLTCDRCVVQWKYRTANTWDKGSDGEFCLGCGPQEEFYNCADVAIHRRRGSAKSISSSSSSSNTSLQSSPTPSSSSSSPASPPLSSSLSLTLTNSVSQKNEGLQNQINIPYNSRNIRPSSTKNDNPYINYSKSPYSNSKSIYYNNSNKGNNSRNKNKNNHSNTSQKVNRTRSRLAMLKSRKTGQLLKEFQRKLKNANARDRKNRNLNSKNDNQDISKGTNLAIKRLRNTKFEEMSIDTKQGQNELGGSEDFTRKHGEWTTRILKSNPRFGFVTDPVRSTTRKLFSPNERLTHRSKLDSWRASPSPEETSRSIPMLWEQNSFTTSRRNDNVESVSSTKSTKSTKSTHSRDRIDTGGAGTAGRNTTRETTRMSRNDLLKDEESTGSSGLDKDSRTISYKVGASDMTREQQSLDKKASMDPHTRSQDKSYTNRQRFEILRRWRLDRLRDKELAERKNRQKQNQERTTHQEIPVRNEGARSRSQTMRRPATLPPPPPLFPSASKTSGFVRKESLARSNRPNLLRKQDSTVDNVQNPRSRDDSADTRLNRQNKKSHLKKHLPSWLIKALRLRNAKAGESNVGTSALSRQQTTLGTWNPRLRVNYGSTRVPSNVMERDFKKGRYTTRATRRPTQGRKSTYGNSQSDYFSGTSVRTPTRRKVSTETEQEEDESLLQFIVKLLMAEGKEKRYGVRPMKTSTYRRKIDYQRALRPSSSSSSPRPRNSRRNQRNGYAEYPVTEYRRQSYRNAPVRRMGESLSSANRQGPHWTRQLSGRISTGGSGTKHRMQDSFTNRDSRRIGMKRRNPHRYPGSTPRQASRYIESAISNFDHSDSGENAITSPYQNLEAMRAFQRKLSRGNNRVTRPAYTTPRYNGFTQGASSTLLTTPQLSWASKTSVAVPEVPDENMHLDWTYRSQKRQKFHTQRAPLKPELVCKSRIQLAGGMDMWCNNNCNANFCPPTICKCREKQVEFEPTTLASYRTSTSALPYTSTLPRMTAYSGLSARRGLSLAHQNPSKEAESRAARDNLQHRLHDVPNGYNAYSRYHSEDHSTPYSAKFSDFATLYQQGQSSSSSSSLSPSSSSSSSSSAFSSSPSFPSSSFPSSSSSSAASRVSAAVLPRPSIINTYKSKVAALPTVTSGYHKLPSRRIPNSSRRSSIPVRTNKRSYQHPGLVNAIQPHPERSSKTKTGGARNLGLGGTLAQRPSYRKHQTSHSQTLRRTSSPRPRASRISRPGVTIASLPTATEPRPQPSTRNSWRSQSSTASPLRRGAGFQRRQLRCRAVGSYAGLAHFDSWCSTICSSSMCPLLMCHCEV